MRVSEVTNKCLKVPLLTSRSDFHFKCTSLLMFTPLLLGLDPTHSHPPCKAEEAEEQLTSPTRLRGYKSPVDWMGQLSLGERLTPEE